MYKGKAGFFSTDKKIDTLVMAIDSRGLEIDCSTY